MLCQRACSERRRGERQWWHCSAINRIMELCRWGPNHSPGDEKNNNSSTNIFTGRRESPLPCSLLSLGVLSTISMLEICGIQRRSRVWQQLLFGVRSPRTGTLWGARSRVAANAVHVTMHLPLRGAEFSPGGGAQTAAGPAGDGDAGERAGGSFSPPGSLAGTCFFLWLLRLHGAGGVYTPYLWLPH